MPHVIARKYRTPVPAQTRHYSVPPFREAPSRRVVVPPPPGMPEVSSDYEVEADPDDPVSISSLVLQLVPIYFNIDRYGGRKHSRQPSHKDVSL